LNGINAIRVDTNAARHAATASHKKRIVPLTELKTATDADKKKQFKTETYNEFSSNKKQTNNPSSVLLSDRKYYRANLLNEIVNKMAGLDERTKPGYYVEYYA
jgi:hypothetical protein